MIVEALAELLMADPAVSALVGDRIFPRLLPDGATFPAIVITKVSGGGTYTNGGDTGLETARVQIDCYSADGASAVIELKTAVRRKLSGFRGGPASGSPCAIASSFCTNDVDLTAPETERSGPRLKRRMLEFSIWNREV